MPHPQMTKDTLMNLNNPQLPDLRPTPDHAFTAWTQLVLNNREQIERLRERQPTADFYQSRAGQFRPDRRPSPELPYLLQIAQPQDHWLDIGAGGGRFAVPIAQHVTAVHAVEPSPAMRETLAAAAAEANLTNIHTYDLRWPTPDANVPTADVSLASHMLYDQEDLHAFLQAMEAHTRRLCVVIVGNRAPSSAFEPLWTELYGEPARLLPARHELLAALGALDRRFDVKTFPMPPSEPIELDDALARARFLYWLEDGSDRQALARQWLSEHLSTEDGRIAMPARVEYTSVISWPPGGTGLA
ncbi:MAG: methyltransferase domain-containing protein [Dehalococcoidia bacterium]|nr:methyltransferase domain-containing protein [Dehalococcoidia bacterium]